MDSVIKVFIVRLESTNIQESFAQREELYDHKMEKKNSELLYNIIVVQDCLCWEFF